VVAPTGATAVERGVFAEIAIDRRATAQGTGILLAAALMEGGGSSGLVIASGIQSWLVEEGGVALASSAAAAVLLWRLARFGGGRGTVLGLWRAIAFALAPIVLGAFGFAGSLVGGALAVPSIRPRRRGAGPTLRGVLRVRGPCPRLGLRLFDCSPPRHHDDPGESSLSVRRRAKSAPRRGELEALSLLNLAIDNSHGGRARR
jgi:hypothetical protein